MVLLASDTAAHWWTC